MKKIISVLLTGLLLLSCFSFSTFAIDVSEQKTAEEIAITTIPNEAYQYHNNIVNGVSRSIATSTYNEYEIIKMFEEMSVEELQVRGYSADVIEAIENENLEEIILEETFERASLTESELLNMGYTEEEIAVLHDLTGEETLEQISARGILADCTCYNTLVDHYYRTSTGKTYFLVSYGWEWDKCPVWLLTDCAGVGWNHDFHPDDSLDTSYMDYNTTYKEYVNQLNASDVKYTAEPMLEKQLNTCEDQLDMNGFYGSMYYVKAGWGTMALSQTGIQNDVKFSFKYGHNEIFAAPSVGYPWSVSFSLEGAESIFMPPELVYSDFARVINDNPIITLGFNEE